MVGARNGRPYVGVTRTIESPKRMPFGHFIWTDLSTYDMAAARSDYTDLFGWSFGGSDDYDFARMNGRDVAAVFPMPHRLAQMDMPSFWMSYVHVDDLDGLVEKAKRHDNVIIEVSPQPFDSHSRIALVRDPSGAGFTLYQGPELGADGSGPGRVQTRFHHLPDIALIKDFYADLFGWEFTPNGAGPWPTYDVLHPDGSKIAIIEEVPEAVRGKFRYWMPCFRVDSVEGAVRRILARKGGHSFDLSGRRALVFDRQGAHFMVSDAELANASP